MAEVLFYLMVDALLAASVLLVVRGFVFNI